MPKLHLKRTPEEEAARKLRKEARKSHKKRSSALNRSPSPSHKRPRRSDEPQERPWDSSDGETEYGPQPSTSTNPNTNSRPISLGPAPHAYKPDYEQIRAEIEEQKFREKMCGAFEDDERLDSLEARLNDFAHVPDRWRIGGIPGKGKTRYYEEDNDEFLKMDPRYMDEEEYAEWIRAGMYRKTHADEYAEQLRKKALKAERRAQEKAAREETQRLEKLAEEERRRKKQEKENRRWDYAREWYDKRWKELLAPGEDDGLLDFDDIPWPVVTKVDRRGYRTGSISLEHLTVESISTFLLPINSALEDPTKKERKEKLRETMLRFHPDKFEGRLMKRVKEGERDKVKEAIGQVVRALNTLMGEGP